MAGCACVVMMHEIPMCPTVVVVGFTGGCWILLFHLEAPNLLFELLDHLDEFVFRVNKAVFSATVDAMMLAEVSVASVSSW